MLKKGKTKFVPYMTSVHRNSQRKLQGNQLTAQIYCMDLVMDLL